jgi:hypothetical protein
VTLVGVVRVAFDQVVHVLSRVRYRRVTAARTVRMIGGVLVRYVLGSGPEGASHARLPPSGSSSTCRIDHW